MRVKVRLLMMLLGVGASWMVGCAGLPQQIRPANPEPFYGSWTGTWKSHTSPWGDGGAVDAQILPALRPDQATSAIRLTSQLDGGKRRVYSNTGVFEKGQIVFETPWKSTLEFVLYGENRIEVSYFNPVNGDHGSWSLTRRP